MYMLGASMYVWFTNDALPGEMVGLQFATDEKLQLQLIGW
jgi:hypothetical protein